MRRMIIFLLILLVGVGYIVGRKYNSGNSVSSGGSGSNLISLSCEIDSFFDEEFIVTTLEELNDIIPKDTNITVHFTGESKNDELVIGEQITLRFLNLEKKEGNYVLYLDSPNTIEKDGKDLLNYDGEPIWPPSSEDSKK